MIIENYLIAQNSNDPELLYYCFVLIDQQQHDKAIHTAPTLAENLPPKTAAILLFKLVLVIGRELVDAIDAKYAIALLQFANLRGGVYSEKVSAYLSATPFQDWPLDEGIFNSELAAFLEREGIGITVDDWGKLDRQHWVFIAGHINFFEREKVLDFIAANPVAFRDIDVRAVYRQPHQDSTFVFIGSPDCSKLAAASPLLALGKIVDSVPLLVAFFRHSTLCISQALFDQVLVAALRSASSTMAVIEYAMTHRLDIDPLHIVKHTVFQSDTVLPALVRYLAKYGGIPHLPPELASLLVSKIGRPISPDLITSHTPVHSALIPLDPDFFLQHVINSSKFSFFQFQTLTRLVAECPFDPVLLHELIAIHLSVYTGMNPPKKKALLLRFITASIVSLRSRGLSVESDHISALACASFDTLVEMAPAVVSVEVAELLRVLIPRSQNLAPFTAFLSQPRSLFLEAATILFCQSRIKLISADMFILAFESRRPSAQARAVRALQRLLFFPTRFTGTIVSASLAAVFPTLASLALTFATVRDSIPFMKVLFESRERVVLPPGFFETFAVATLGDSRWPCFLEALPICQCFVDCSPDVVDQVFSIGFANKSVFVALEVLFDWTKTDQVRLKGLADRIADFFVENPIAGVAAIILRILRETDAREAMGCFFLNHIGERRPFLPMYVVLARLTEESGAFAAVVGTLNGQLTPMSRPAAVHAERQTPEEVAKAFLLAAAETDDTAAIRREFEICAVCKC
jgi:hypothetical protein